MLKLHDPMSEVRARFREVWKRYSDGDSDGAGQLLEESVQTYLKTAIFQDELEESDDLQKLLIEEKHRWEDVQEIASLVAQQLQQTGGGVAETAPSEFESFVVVSRDTAKASEKVSWKTQLKQLQLRVRHHPVDWIWPV